MRQMMHMEEQCTTLIQQQLTLVDVVPAMILNRLDRKVVPRRIVVLGVCSLRLDDLAGKLAL